MSLQFAGNKVWRIYLLAIVAMTCEDTSAFDCTEDLRKLNYTVPYHTGFCKLLENQHRLMEQYILKRRDWQTSNLGTILFKNVEPYIYQNSNKRKTYVVLIWSSWLELVEKHSSGYHPTQALKLWAVRSERCTVKNCVFTGNRVFLDRADAVVISLQKSALSLPNVESRRSDQRWIFMIEQSPMSISPKRFTLNTLNLLNNTFNWSMTYRSDSDIPIPFGRTIPLPQPDLVFMDKTENALLKLVPFWYEKQTVVPIAILMNECVPHVMSFFLELRKNMRIDALGACFDDFRCTDKDKDCKLLKDYVFYLVLESSSCRQYLTEKCFYNAYSKGAIPVIMGPILEDCEKLLPPNSFLHVDSYISVHELASHINHIVKSPEDILFYHGWRRNFKIVNERGTFEEPSALFCRICEALTYNDEMEKSYDVDELSLFLNRDLSCNVGYSTTQNVTDAERKYIF